MKLTLIWLVNSSSYVFNSSNTLKFLTFDLKLYGVNLERGGF